MLSQWQLLYQISPIILTGGIANNISGGMLPFLSLANSNAFSSNLLSGNPGFTLEDAFATFQPWAGGTLVEQVPATYPFANITVAANAIVKNPINVSLLMLTPMKQVSSWAVKLSTMQSLKATLDAHNNAEGTYTVCTPAYIYTDMLMIALVDVSMGNSPLPQNAWRWDFTKPLVSLADAQGALGNLMSKISSGLQVPASVTGAQTAIGAAPSSTNQGLGAGGTSPIVDSPPTSSIGPPLTLPGSTSVNSTPPTILGD